MTNSETFNKLNKELNNMPSYKKEEYNEMFISKHAKKLNLEKQYNTDFLDGLRAFENAIAEEYGFEYNKDSANISWHDLDLIAEKVKNNLNKYL